MLSKRSFGLKDGGDDFLIAPKTEKWITIFCVRWFEFRPRFWTEYNIRLLLTKYRR